MVIDSILVDSVRTSWGWVDSINDGSYLISHPDYPVERAFTVTTYYHGKGLPEQEGTLHWGGVSDQDTMMFAMGVGFNAPYTGCTRHWMPCYDLPDDKPDSVDLTFICRDSDVTASNGLLVSNTVSNGWRTMHWHVSHPIATYLLTFATGPYTKFDVSNSLSKPFEVFCLRRDSLRTAIHMNVRVRQILAFYDSLFAPYPFEKVGYVVTPFGSMEHQTMISLDKRAITGDSASMVIDASGNGTVAIHELAHMWWGDWVTCKTFDDAWLNEGFATFCESLSLERLLGRAKYLTRQHNNIAGAKTSILPLFGAPTVDHHSNNYPYETIYQKGASVLGMLRLYLGDSIFFDCVRYYGNAHAYSTATSADLENAFEQVSGKDLAWFWKEWVYGIGYPKDTIVWYKRQTGAPIEFHQKFNNVGAPYFRMPIPIRGYLDGASTDVVAWMDSTQTSWGTANFGFPPDSIKIDPEGLLLMQTIKTSYSSSVTPLRGSGKSTLQVFPNPDRHNRVTYALTRQAGGFDTKFRLIDGSGQVVREWTDSSRDCCIQRILDMTGLSAGSYHLVAEYPGDSISTTISFTP